VGAPIFGPVTTPAEALNGRAMSEVQVATIVPR
jgi:hypothetical protein